MTLSGYPAEPACTWHIRQDASKRCSRHEAGDFKIRGLQQAIVAVQICGRASCCVSQLRRGRMPTLLQSRTSQGSPDTCQSNSKVTTSCNKAGIGDTGTDAGQEEMTAKSIQDWANHRLTLNHVRNGILHLPRSSSASRKQFVRNARSQESKRADRCMQLNVVTLEMWYL